MSKVGGKLKAYTGKKELAVIVAWCNELIALKSDTTLPGVLAYSKLEGFVDADQKSVLEHMERLKSLLGVRALKKLDTKNELSAIVKGINVLKSEWTQVTEEQVLGSMSEVYDMLTKHKADLGGDLSSFDEWKQKLDSGTSTLKGVCDALSKGMEASKAKLTGSMHDNPKRTELEDVFKKLAKVCETFGEVDLGVELKVSELKEYPSILGAADFTDLCKLVAKVGEDIANLPVGHELKRSVGDRDKLILLHTVHTPKALGEGLTSFTSQVVGNKISLHGILGNAYIKVTDELKGLELLEPGDQIHPSEEKLMKSLKAMYARIKHYFTRKGITELEGFTYSEEPMVIFVSDTKPLMKKLKDIGILINGGADKLADVNIGGAVTGGATALMALTVERVGDATLAGHIKDKLVDAITNTKEIGGVLTGVEGKQDGVTAEEKLIFELEALDKATKALLFGNVEGTGPNQIGGYEYSAGSGPSVVAGVIEYLTNIEKYKEILEATGAILDEMVVMQGLPGDSFTSGYNISTVVGTISRPIRTVKQGRLAMEKMYDRTITSGMPLDYLGLLANHNNAYLVSFFEPGAAVGDLEQSRQKVGVKVKHLLGLLEDVKGKPNHAFSDMYATDQMKDLPNLENYGSYMGIGYTGQITKSEINFYPLNTELKVQLGTQHDTSILADPVTNDAIAAMNYLLGNSGSAPELETMVFYFSMLDNKVGFNALVKPVDRQCLWNNDDVKELAINFVQAPISSFRLGDGTLDVADGSALANLFTGDRSGNHLISNNGATSDVSAPTGVAQQLDTTYDVFRLTLEQLRKTVTGTRYCFVVRLKYKGATNWFTVYAVKQLTFDQATVELVLTP